MRLKAFTLIETILYLALFNIIFFSVITFTISMTQNNKTAEYKNAVEKNALLVTEHLRDTFSQGLTVDSANSVFSLSPGVVRVTLASGYRQYSINSGTLIMNNGAADYDLTDKFVTVTNFVVDPVMDASSVIIGARISITLTAEKYPTLTKTMTSFYAFR